MSSTNYNKSDSESWDLLTFSLNNVTLQCPIWTGVVKWHYFASVQTSWGIIKSDLCVIIRESVCNVMIVFRSVFLQATKNPFYLHVGMDILQSIEKNAKVRYGSCVFFWGAEDACVMDGG